MFKTYNNVAGNSFLQSKTRPKRYKWAGDDEKGINISLRESSVTWGKAVPKDSSLGEEQRFLPNLGRWPSLGPDFTPSLKSLMLESAFWWKTNLSNSSSKKKYFFHWGGSSNWMMLCINIVHFRLHITHCLYWQSGIFYWPAGYLVQALAISSARFWSYETVSLALNEERMIMVQMQYMSNDDI